MNLQQRIYEQIKLQSSDTQKAKVIPIMDSYEQFQKIEKMILTGIDNLEVSPSLIELIGLTSKVSKDDFLDEQTILKRLKEIRETFSK